MKRSAQNMRIRLSVHAAFCGYRWLAWIIAGLALTLPSHADSRLPRDAGLFVLLFIGNVLLTLFARGYVRLAQRRPLLLALDLIASITVVWTSGGGALPFMPYALGSLILPALLFGWPGALTAAGLLVGIDLLAITFASSVPTDGTLLLTLVMRLLAPLAFSSCWVALAQLLPGNSDRDSPSSAARADAIAGPAAPSHDSAAALIRVGDRPPLDRVSSSAEPQQPGAAPLAMVRLVPAPVDAARRALFDMTPGPEVGLPSALEQLALNLNRQGGAHIRMALVGSARSLTQAQQSVLVRIAQEALLNAQQHARARSVLVTLTYEPLALTLVVQDDGVGLLDGTYERPGLHALRALRYRVAELDGQFAVFESDSGGVTVRTTLPLL